MTPQNSDDSSQELNAATELNVGDICNKVGAAAGVQMPPVVINTLAELAMDTVIGEGVKVLTRRNPHLSAHLSSMSRERPN